MFIYVTKAAMDELLGQLVVVTFKLTYRSFHLRTATGRLQLPGHRPMKGSYVLTLPEDPDHPIYLRSYLIVGCRAAVPSSL